MPTDLADLGLLTGSQTASFWLCPHMVAGTKNLSGVFYKGTNAIQDASVLMTSSPPKGPPTPNIITLRIEFQHGDFGRTQMFICQQGL